MAEKNSNIGRRRGLNGEDLGEYRMRQDNARLSNKVPKIMPKQTEEELKADEAVSMWDKSHDLYSNHSGKHLSTAYTRPNSNGRPSEDNMRWVDDPEYKAGKKKLIEELRKK